MTTQQWNDMLTHMQDVEHIPGLIVEELQKAYIKIKTQAYDDGFKAGANHQNNKPCVCGFWGRETE